MKFTPILCVTRDEQGAVASSIATIYQACYTMGKSVIYLQNGGYGYALSRTNLFRYAMDTLKIDHVRGFLLDDDVRVLDQPRLQQVVRKADKEHWNIVAPYRTKSGHFSILRTLPEGSKDVQGNRTTMMLGEREMAEIKPWDEIEMAGLGFYYGDIDLKYVFREGNPYAGEDLNFFHDQELHPRLAPLRLDHIKQCAIPGVDYAA